MVRYYALFLYVMANLLLGYYFHRTMSDDSGIKPMPQELVIYVLVVSMFGLPLALAMTVLGFVAGWAHKDPLT